jgi:very-short-patch-repair endonuclease
LRTLSHREREGPAPKAWEGVGLRFMTPETQTARARDLRKRQTHAEAALWQYLRASRLDGFRFRRQHRIDRYFADFACVSLKLVIELDGKVHDEDDQQLNDYHRQQAIESLGWSVLRFSNDQVTGGLPAVLDAIRDHAKLAGAVTPLRMGEGFRKRSVPKARRPKFSP